MTKSPVLPSYRLLFTALKETSCSYFPVLKQAWLPILFLHLSSAALSQYFEYSAYILRIRGREDILLISLTAALELITTTLFSTLWILLIATAARSLHPHTPTEHEEPQPSPPFFRLVTRHLNQLLIEQLRGVAAVIWRIPLLILPALFEFVRLLLIPFVVIFDRRYSEGKIDALQTSRELARGRWLLLALTLLVHALASHFIEELIFGPRSQWAWESPTSFALTTLLTLFIEVFSALFFFAIYRQISLSASSSGEALNE